MKQAGAGIRHPPVSLSKNYSSAPISGKIGMGVFLWMNVYKTRDGSLS